MLISVYVPLVVTAVLSVLAPRPARRLAPRPAAWALACAALVTTVGWTGSLALLAFTGVAQIPEVAAEGRWSVSVLRAEDPVHLTVAVAGALVLLVGFASLVLAAVRQLRHLLWARRECARVPGDGELAVVDADAPQAFALPGAPGRIVVSRGMLRCLDDAEREALLAHERAHLRGRHHLFQTLWRLTAAVNPLLRPLAEAGGYVLERWADEEAAAHVGSRKVVARAVGRAALAASAHASSPPALAVTGGAVPQRVRALLAPPPPRRTLPIAGGALLLTLCCAGLANAASDSDKMVDDAQRAQCAAAAAQFGVDAHFCCRHHRPGERHA
ncbi:MULTISPECIES: M56 family metallopeptidase [Streptomyces]|uniref:M56 family metallopeptidase n=1 Tax=Streptomyces camelliae TaxID=3004093 RepID=A0ABY7PHN0_9ACTN|nr:MULTISPECIES: M56 family metallopeptidase [unclassified Streptomyces]WBO68426.1 M56 family metallopeptidase [Streptomyces sp. HUAS 2-6]